MSNIGYPIYYPIGNTIGVISSLGFSGAVPEIVALFFEDFTDAQNNSFFSYTRSTPQYVETDTGALYPVPAGAIPIQNARPVRNLAASSDTPSTQNITVVVGRIYAVRIGAESASGATAVCSGAFTGTLTGDGADSYALNGSATTTTLTVTITGSVRKLQVQDITHRAYLSTAPDEYVDSATDHGTGVNGFKYFTTALANTVDGSGVVTEATGAALTGIALANVPGATNLADGTHDFSGGADTITLSSTGYYTLWLMGTAQVTIASGTATITGAGSATEGSPLTINCTATGTVTLTLDSGTLDEVNGSQVIMLEPGTVPTAFIPTDGSTASTDAAVLDFSGVTGFTTPNETRVVATGLNASLDPDPTDTTERIIDIDNWDGTDLSDILPHANIKYVKVWKPGERGNDSPIFIRGTVT